MIKISATVEAKIYTGTNAAVESSGDTASPNVLNTDVNDSTGIVYHSSRIARSSSSTGFSYERWIRLKFSGTFTDVTNIKAYLSSGSLVDSNMDLKGGVTDTGVTPVNTVSSVATTTMDSWDSAGEAIDITPAGGIISSPGFSKYLVIQLVTPDGVTEPGDIGLQKITFTWDGGL